MATFDMESLDGDESLSVTMTRKEWLGVLAALTSSAVHAMTVANKVDDGTFHGSAAAASLKDARDAYSGIAQTIADEVVPGFRETKAKQTAEFEQMRADLMDMLFRKDRDDA